MEYKNISFSKKNTLIDWKEDLVNGIPLFNPYFQKIKNNEVIKNENTNSNNKR